jgi:hypothetical protein
MSRSKRNRMRHSPAIPKNPKNARQGHGVWTSLDPLTTTRLKWLRHFANEHLEAPATNSTIVRRALEVLTEQYEDALLFSMTATQAGAERRALNRANRGDLKTLSEDVIQQMPVQRLSYLLRPPARQVLPPLPGSNRDPYDGV